MKQQQSHQPFENYKRPDDQCSKLASISHGLYISRLVELVVAALQLQLFGQPGQQQFFCCPYRFSPHILFRKWSSSLISCSHDKKAWGPLRWWGKWQPSRREIHVLAEHCYLILTSRWSVWPGWLHAVWWMQPVHFVFFMCVADLLPILLACCPSVPLPLSVCHPLLMDPHGFWEGLLRVCLLNYVFFGHLSFCAQCM